MDAQLKDLLKKAGDGILTEETLTAIETAFNSAVDTKIEPKVKERLQLEVESALTKQDEEHAGKLEKLLEAVDADHVKKLKAVVKTIDENHTGKLKFIVKKQHEQLQTEALKLRNLMVNRVNDFLELYLDKTMPQAQLAEAVANTQARKMLGEIKKIISVDKEYVTEEIRQAILDGKQKMDNLEKQLNTTIKESVELHQAKLKAESDLILEKSTAGFPENKKAYVNKVLGDKEPKYITENFNYVVEMFERDEQDEAELLRESAEKKAVSRNVDASQGKETGEEVSNSSSGDPVHGYLSELQRLDRGLKTANT